nr:MADS-box transcription factor 6 [Tanacetum cinerariifolium]
MSKAYLVSSYASGPRSDQFETDGQGYRTHQLPCPWNSSNNNTFQMHHSQSNPMVCQQEQPILQIGYNLFMQGEGSSGERNMVGETNIHGWAI